MYSMATNNRSQHTLVHHSGTHETSVDAHKLTFVTGDDVHDIFEDEEIPKFH